MSQQSFNSVDALLYLVDAHLPVLCQHVLAEERVYTVEGLLRTAVFPDKPGSAVHPRVLLQVFQNCTLTC